MILAKYDIFRRTGLIPILQKNLLLHMRHKTDCCEQEWKIKFGRTRNAVGTATNQRPCFLRTVS